MQKGYGNTPLSTWQKKIHLICDKEYIDLFIMGIKAIVFIPTL